MPVEEILRGAIQHHQAGRLDLAASLYEQALKRAPANDDAHHLLGVVAHQKGEHQLAIGHISQAIAVRPSVADFHLNLGSAHQALGQLDEAIRCFQHALRLNPNLALAHNNLGNARKDQGRIHDALKHYEASLRLNPASAQTYSNRAAALLELGDLRSAEASLQNALQINPGLGEAHSNLGILHARRGETEAAFSSYHHALRLQPNLPKAWSNLGSLLYDQGKIDDARTAYTQVAQIRQQPVWMLRAASLCPVVPQSNEEIDDFRGRFTSAIEEFETVRPLASPDELSACGSEPPFYLPYHGRNDRLLKSRYAGLFASGFPPCDPIVSEGIPHVGFVVADRHEAVFVRFMSGIVNRLPSDDLKVSIVCSNAGRSVLARSISNARVEYVTIPNRLSLAAAAVRAAAIDILFHFEVGTDGLTYFLPFYQAAPVQCTSWGVPVTSGIPAMNYFISSELLEPAGAEDHYTEQLIRLGTLPVCYGRPDPPQRKGREAFGLPAQAHLYCCPHSLFKFHPDFDEALARILRQDPVGKIVLVEGRQRHWAELLIRRFRRVMPDVADRIVFLPKQNHENFVSLLECCDVALDPFRFGGGATTYEAMSVGIPTVTLPGEFMRGRVTAACYHKMGVIDCVAATLEEYVQRAVQLGTDCEHRAAVQSKILAANDVLYDDRAAVEELREFFLQNAHTTRRA